MCASEVGANHGQQDTKRSATQLPLQENQEHKAGGWEQKQGVMHVPCAQHHQRGGQTT